MLKRQRMEFDEELLTPGYVAHFQFVAGVQRMSATADKDETTLSVLSGLDEDNPSGLEGKVVDVSTINSLSGEVVVFTVEYYPRSEIDFGVSKVWGMSDGYTFPSNQMEEMTRSYICIPPKGPTKKIKIKSPSEVTKLALLKVDKEEKDILIGSDPYTGEERVELNEYYMYNLVLNPEVANENFGGYDDGAPSYSDHSDEEEG